MKLTRKQLNHILLQLPDPNLVLQGRISPTIKVPVYKPMDVIHSDTNYKNTISEKIKELTFEYSHKEMDWQLKDLEI